MGICGMALCVVCGEEGLEEVEENGDIHLILVGLGKLGMEDSHGEGYKEWKNMYVILMEDGWKIRVFCEVLLFFWVRKVQ